jgi:hypothetical protein
MLDIEAIKKAHGPKFFEIDVPEWGGTVLAKRISAPEYIELQSAPQGDSTQETFDYLLRLVRMLLVKEDGSALIDDDNVYLLADNPSVVARLGGELIARNGLGTEPKNSESTP